MFDISKDRWGVETFWRYGTLFLFQPISKFCTRPQIRLVRYIQGFFDHFIGIHKFSSHQIGPFQLLVLMLNAKRHFGSRGRSAKCTILSAYAGSTSGSGHRGDQRVIDRRAWCSAAGHQCGGCKCGISRVKHHFRWASGGAKKIGWKLRHTKFGNIIGGLRERVSWVRYRTWNWADNPTLGKGINLKSHIGDVPFSL